MLTVSTSFSYNRGVDSAPSYHHGNLRETLLDAAAKLVAEGGPGAFTLREVARRVGVSHNAPYRHFKDRDEVMAAVAAQGFERLTAAMRRSAAKGATALERFRLCGRGYIAFALRWPEHFLIMFDLPSRVEGYPEYAAAAREAFEVLRESIEAAQNDRVLSPGDPEPMALVAWALVHGIAKLATSGRLPFRAARVLEFASYGESVLMEGLVRASHPGAFLK